MAKHIITINNNYYYFAIMASILTSFCTRSLAEADLTATDIRLLVFLGLISAKLRYINATEILWYG